MDVFVLQEFASLVETCSFQETAARMNVSQSALTKHIHKLEEELNLSLFDRSTRNVKLNEYSKALYPYAKNIVQLNQEALVTLEELSAKDKDQFTIAYTPVVGQYGIVDTVSDFSKKYPEHNMLTLETYQPIPVLKSNRCSFAFVLENDAVDDSFNRMIYKTDHLAVVLPCGHPLADKQTITLEQLSGEKFILHGSPNDVPHEETQKFLDLCASSNFEPNIVAESQFTSTMIRYVTAGRGIAILNRLHIATETPGISVVDIYPTTRSYIYLVYPRKMPSAAATDFLHYMIEQINQ
ncbi:MAG: LysR family transcriptional regulator [Lachnospiraceae bacterium]|nr:LysR family transcriptional regulator [Lachnospiraceae bacterium]